MERLSKLQKWILEECFKRNNEITRWKLVDMCKITPALEVSISRSIRNLIKKGFIFGYTSGDIGMAAMFDGMTGKSQEETIKQLSQFKKKDKLAIPFIGYGKIKLIVLTKKGVDKAKELLMLNPDTDIKLNNKENNVHNTTPLTISEEQNNSELRGGVNKI